MKKILVTGGAGFIGSHLVDRLIKEGYKALIVDNLSSGKKGNINPKAEFINLDICSQKFTDTLGKIKPDIIYHLAAQSSIAESFKNPQKDFEINLFATLKLLETAKDIRTSKIIFASSAAVFGSAKKLPIDENEAKKPISYYGISKLCSEYIFESYRRRFNLKYACLRFANVYGPRQDASGEGGVVAVFANNLIRQKPLVIYGTGEQTRDFIYVSDVVDALIKSLDVDAIGTYNVGTSKQASINQLAKKLININGEKRVRIVYKQKRFLEVEKSALSHQKIKKIAEFEPQVALGKGLAKTLNFFKKV